MLLLLLSLSSTSSLSPLLLCAGPELPAGGGAACPVWEAKGQLTCRNVLDMAS